MFLFYNRTMLMYLLLIAMMCFLGKRQIGQMETSEFVVTLLVADLAAIPKQEETIPLLHGVIPILIVLGMEIILSWLSLRSIRLRKLLCGKPVILIENGNILQKSLRKNRITLDELTEMLRQKDVLDLKQVQYAILETNGELSVFPYPKERPASARDAGIQARKQYLPLTVISDGTVLVENLKKAGKDKRWLEKVLRAHNAGVKDTWLLTVDGGDRVVFYRKDS